MVVTGITLIESGKALVPSYYSITSRLCTSIGGLDSKAKSRAGPVPNG